MPSWIDADDERRENTQTEKNKTATGRRFRLHLAGPCSPSGAAAAVIVITRPTSDVHTARLRGHCSCGCGGRRRRQIQVG